MQELNQNQRKCRVSGRLGLTSVLVLTETSENPFLADESLDELEVIPNTLILLRNGGSRAA